MTAPEERPPFGADEQFAETLTVLNEERAADRCKCSHHRHDERCPSAACGCTRFRLRVVDATYTRAQEYQMDAAGDYDHHPEEE